MTEKTSLDTTELAKALLSRGWQNSCPSCRKGTFQVQNGMFINVLQDDLDKIVLGGTTIPVAVLVCTNCGFVSQHSLGILGLLKKNSSSEQT